MNAKMAHPYRQGSIEVLCRTTRPITLECDGKEYKPLMTKYGMPYYSVPYDYAVRLLSGEPDKFAVLGPSDIEAYFTPRGEQYHRTVVLKMHHVVMDGEEPVREANGLPVYSADPEEEDRPVKKAEKKADKKAQGKKGADKKAESNKPDEDDESDDAPPATGPSDLDLTQL